MASWLRLLLACLAVLLVARVASAQEPEPTPEPTPEPVPEVPVPEPVPLPPPVPWSQPTPQSCAAAPECMHLGLCVAGPTGCVAVPQSCAQSLRCRQLGFCTAENGQCVVGPDRDCRMSYACHTHGLCASQGQRCVATKPQHCSDATICQHTGACTSEGGICVRDSDDDGPTKMRSAALRNTGIAFTIAGPITAAIATGMAFSEDEGVSIAGLAFLAPLGGTFLVMGVPMWALGAADIPVGTEPESMAGLVSGIVLTGLGFSVLTPSAFILVLAEQGNIAGIPMAVSATAIIGGIALSTWGVQSVPVESAALRVGPGSFDLSWRF